jgi:hypothetical protein
MKTPRDFCQISMTLEFSRQILEKISNTKLHENPSNGSQVLPCGQSDQRTDRHDEINSRFSQFWDTRLKTTATPITKTGLLLSLG